MKKLIISCFLIVLTTIGISQNLQIDTVFFKSGRVLPCKIIEITPSNIKVQPMPEYPSFVDTYKHKEIRYYSFNGKHDSLANGNFYAIIAPKISDTTLMPFDYYLEQSGRSLRLSANLFFGSFGLCVSACGFYYLYDRADYQPALYASILSGLAIPVCAIAGYGHRVRSGNLLIKAAKRYSIKTNGSGVTLNF